MYQETSDAAHSRSAPLRDAIRPSDTPGIASVAKAWNAKLAQWAKVFGDRKRFLSNREKPFGTKLGEVTDSVPRVRRDAEAESMPIFRFL